MKIPLQLPFPKLIPSSKINLGNNILLLGSCFTQNIGQRLSEAKFPVIINPRGISFSPLSIAHCLNDCLTDKSYNPKDLFKHNGIWHSYNFHSSFSAPVQEEAVEKMNQSVHQASECLKEVDWIIVTLGTAFQYETLHDGKAVSVANCHQVPPDNFSRRLLSTPEITRTLKISIDAIKALNPEVKFIWTVSPVRHKKDGLVENNRSKGRLLEASHQLNELVSDSWYFPAYEILIDVLRDYRFYDLDWVHPNPLAVDIIWEQFQKQFFSENVQTFCDDLEKIQKTTSHRPRFQNSETYQQFLAASLTKIKQLEQRFPGLNLDSERAKLNK